jgi:hypothetical protein
MAKEDMTIDGVNFPKEWAREHSEAEFLAENSHHYIGANQEARLKAAYAKLNPAQETPTVSEVVEPAKKGK